MSKTETNKTESKSGIPEGLELNKVKKWVKGRVSAKRFKHIKGVVEVGARLANSCGEDPFPVELSCWLHDSCKEIKAEELLRMAEGFGLEITEAERRNGHLLHGPVGACVSGKEFGITSHDVLSGISEHTLGSAKMTRVSKLVYLADILEASRPEALTSPIWQALCSGKQLEEKGLEPDLDAAILTASDLVLSHLIEKGKFIHPKAVAVRNHFLEVVTGRKST